MEPRYLKIIEKVLSTRARGAKVLAVLVTGSFARGLQTKDSDLDLQIITSNSSQRRTRGNVVIDGVLIEYCINPFKQVKRYLDIDAEHNNPMMCTALLEGKVILEKYAAAQRLKCYAATVLRRGYRSIPPTRASFDQYVLADTLNKMESVYAKHRDDFTFLYHVHVKLIYETYARFLRQPVLKEPMLADYFTGNNRFSHVIGDFPDHTFARLFRTALHVRTPKTQIASYRALTTHVLQHMGGFKLDGWQLSIPVDYTWTMDKRTRIF